jgi:hypothetical protein
MKITPSGFRTGTAVQATFEVSIPAKCPPDEKSGDRQEKPLSWLGIQALPSRDSRCATKETDQMLPAA